MQLQQRCQLLLPVGRVHQEGHLLHTSLGSFPGRGPGCSILLHRDLRCVCTAKPRHRDCHPSYDHPRRWRHRCRSGYWYSGPFHHRWCCTNYQTSHCCTYRVHRRHLLYLDRDCTQGCIHHRLGKHPDDRGPCARRTDRRFSELEPYSKPLGFVDPRYFLRPTNTVSIT